MSPKRLSSPIVTPPHHPARPTPPSLASQHLSPPPPPPPAERQEVYVEYVENPMRHVQIDRRGVRELAVISVAIVLGSAIFGAATAQ